jgi:uncharacterized membrane protein YdbT with pleckstrin-like domain
MVNQNTDTFEQELVDLIQESSRQILKWRIICFLLMAAVPVAIFFGPGIAAYFSEQASDMAFLLMFVSVMLTIAVMIVLIHWILATITNLNYYRFKRGMYKRSLSYLQSGDNMRHLLDRKFVIPPKSL